MPAFTAVGAYVAGTLLGLAGTAATIVGAIVATGAAYVTSRVINGNPNKGGNAAAGSQGGRIQVAPATNNKIPVIYGNAYVNGMITDARLISLENKVNDVMYYCIVLGETTNNPSTSYGIEGVYWNDLRLTALAATGENSHIVKDGRKVVDGAIVTAGSFVVGTTYVITKLGTTTQAQWNTIAGTSGRTYGPGSVFEAATVGVGTGQAQVEDFIDTNFIVDTDQYVMMRVYAGGSTAADQIYPPPSAGNSANAYNFWGSSPANPNGDGSWTSANEMKGLVFAIVKLRYSGDKGFTSLPNVTFQVANNVTNPADVWYDYMTSERYGAGIDPTYIDTTAQAEWYNFCEEDISYTSVNLDPAGGAGTTNQATSRYSINGVIDTNNQVKTNIDTILQNGGAWMSYNVDTGLWSPIIKKAVSAGDPFSSPPKYFTASRSGSTLTVTAFTAGRIEAGQALYNSTGTLIGTISAQLTPTAGETAGQVGRYTTSTSGSISSTSFYTLPVGSLEFTDDNITSGITLSSTRLEDLYNSVEVEFYNKYNKDQKAYFRNYLAAGDRNPNEPDNQLRMSLDLCNNSMQSDILGQMELRQSRDDLVIEFTTNHYGIQAQAGDVIAVTTELYGWAPKYFRVMRVKEIEGDDGDLTAQIQALEYNPDAYTIEAISEFSTSSNIGIGVAGASPNLPPPPDVIIAAVDADAPVPNFQLQVTVPTTGGPFDEIELYYTEGWDQHPITGSIVPGTGSNGAPVGQGLLTVTATTYGNINPGDRIDLLAPANDIFVVSQLTNSPASKTFVSGGVPASSTSTLLTLNNVTGLIVGNTLTGTGIPNGSFIIEIDAGTNTVRIEDAVTVQAAGTYTVSGGLGTYVVDTSTTVSGTADLYDFPEADNYKLLKKLVPEGNNPTFTNGEIVTDIVTTVPANSATYRRWFVKARMGIKKRFGELSNPGDTDFEKGRFPYTPNPVGGGGLPGVMTSLVITDTTDAPNAATGSIVTAGGVGIAKKLHIGGTFKVDDTLEATNAGTGSIQTDGGVGVALKLHVGGTIRNDDTRNATNTTDGSIQTDGGVSVALDAYIGGDITVAGNDIKSSSATAITLSGSDVTTAGSLTVNGNTIKSNGGTTAITLSGNDVIIADVLKITGNQIRSSTDAPAISLSNNNVTVEGDLTIGTTAFNYIKTSGGINAIELNGSDVKVFGDLQLGSNRINNSLDATVITLNGLDTRLTGDLRVGGNDIKSWNGAVETTAITLSGDDVAIPGDLTVTGSIKSNTLAERTASTRTTTSISPVALMTTYRPTLKAIITIRRTSGGHVQTMELLAQRYTTATALVTIYGELFSGDPAYPGGSFADIQVVMSGNLMTLQATPLSTDEFVFVVLADATGVDASL